MTDAPKLRSRAWFDNPANIDMTALYLERYLNFGLSLEELRSGKPIIGIAQTGSDLSPCNRHHLAPIQLVLVVLAMSSVLRSLSKHTRSLSASARSPVAGPSRAFHSPFAVLSSAESPLTAIVSR